MKVSLFERVLIGLAGVVFAAVGICIMLATGNVVDIIDTFALDLLLGDSWLMTTLAYLVGVLVIVWGAWLCVLSVRNVKKRAGEQA